MTAAFSPEELRNAFPAFAGGAAPVAYLDAAATAPRLACALDAAHRFDLETNANPRRGLYPLAVAATAAFEDARREVAAFLGVEPEGIAFTSGATEGLNGLAAGLSRGVLGEGDDLWVTSLEHHANLLPWQRAAQARGARLRVLPAGPDGLLSPGALDAALAAAQRPKLVALTAMSNVLGAPQPVAELCAVAHRRGARVVVDASQAVAHVPPSAWGGAWDWLVFSGHKIGAPMGIGVLAGRDGALEEVSPWRWGGEMVDDVPADALPVLSALPARLEGGTPNAAGAVALAAACRWLASLPAAAREWPAVLARDAAARLAALPRVRLLAPPHPQAPLFSFVVEGVHPHDAAQILADCGVAVRAGHLCARPLLRSLGLEAAVRASFFLHNGARDADALVAAVSRLLELFP